MEASGAISTPQVQHEEQKQDEYPIIRFTVRPQNNVNFAVGTIDNENMGKRKSKGEFHPTLMTYFCSVLYLQ